MPAREDQGLGLDIAREWVWERVAMASVDLLPSRAGWVAVAVAVGGDPSRRLLPPPPPPLVPARAPVFPLAGAPAEAGAGCLMEGLGETFTAMVTAMLTATTTAITATVMGITTVGTFTGAVDEAEEEEEEEEEEAAGEEMGDEDAIGTATVTAMPEEQVEEHGGRRGIASWTGRTGRSGSGTGGGTGSENVRDLAAAVVLCPARLCRGPIRSLRRTETRGVLWKSRG